MAKSLQEKLFLKTEYKKAILHVPDGLHETFEQNDLTNALNFILAFYITKHDLEKEVSSLKNSLEEDGLLWTAYPKGKALKTDLNRDILREFMKEYTFEGVSIISLDDTWSAMRFKKYTHEQ